MHTWDPNVRVKEWNRTLVLLRKHAEERGMAEVSGTVIKQKVSGTGPIGH